MSTKLSDYGYDLPEHLIAQHPTQKRDEARLLVIDRTTQTISHDVFKNLGQYLPTESTLVVNNSKVIPARLLGEKEGSGGKVEVFLLKRLSDGVSYEVMLRPLAKIKETHTLVFGDNFWCQLVDREKKIVRFNRPDVLEMAHTYGHIPLPPYIKRTGGKATKDDVVDYQTVFARHPGSVAAPTAGLHFTKDLEVGIRTLGCSFEQVTLHVGYGTFKPVECEDVTKHPMHFERYSVSEAAWGRIQQAKKVVAVGTTSCRVIESICRGFKLKDETNLFLYPGKTFKRVDALVTNFHLPYSTLLMLVYAFGGTQLMKKAYVEAVKNEYRFYSYGDGMIIL